MANEQHVLGRETPIDIDFLDEIDVMFVGVVVEGSNDWFEDQLLIFIIGDWLFYYNLFYSFVIQLSDDVEESLTNLPLSCYNALLVLTLNERDAILIEFYDWLGVHPIIVIRIDS